MTNEQIKQKLKIELLKDSKENNFQKKAHFVNFFYTNYLNENLFESPDKYDFLLKSDSHQKYFFSEKETIDFLIEYRFDFLDFDELLSYEIIK